MNFKKYVDISNEIIDIFNSSDLTYLEALVILQFLKEKIIQQRSEKNEKETS